MLDFESICLIGGVFVISAGTLFFIDYLFKHKSYEEAVAEQRQQNSALYNSQRPKLKEKKQKKNNKKVKEKKTKEKETDSLEDSENQTSDAGESSRQHHVEFSEVTVIEEEEEAKEATVAKRKQKKEVVRPILVNRDSSSENIQSNVDSVSPITNHFEELHPKDEFELLNSHKDDSPKESPKGKGKKQNIENEPPTPKQQKSEPQKNKKSSKSQANEGKKTVDVVDKPIAAEPVVEAPVAVTGSSSSPPQGPSKDKKKKKSEISTLRQLAGDKSQEVNISILMPLVRNAEMSRDEVQILIDMLLNKQQDAPVADEWSEGKADPVQKLKRQLAEKEKAVVELEESLVGSQNKLREIRAEFNAEKSLLQQNVREHLENFNKCNAERQVVENKNQTLSMQYKHFNEEHSKMMDQFNNLQLKHQQLEVHLAQKQEAELNQMQLHEQKSKEDLAERERRIAELLHVNKELERNLELELQNKDKSRLIADEAMCMKQQLEAMHQQKEDEINSYKSDIMHLQSEHVTLSEENNQLKNEIANLQSESSSIANRFDISEKAQASLLEETSQWREDNLKLQEEKSKLQEENSKLQEETATLSSEKQALLQEKSTEAEEKMELAKGTEELKGLKLKLETDISKLEAENKKLQADVVVLIEDKEALEAKCTGNLETNEKQIVQLQAELAEANSNFQNMKEQLHKQLEEQRNKNNLMITNARAEEQQAGRDFVQKLFPILEVPSSTPHDKWEEVVMRTVNNEVTKLTLAARGKDQTKELNKLVSKIAEYKKIIDETEGMLTKLHKHIEQEETRWRKELSSKDEKIERLEAEAQRAPIQADVELDISLNRSIELRAVPRKSPPVLADSDLDTTLLNKTIEAKAVSSIKSQNHSNPTNGPTPSAISHDNNAK